MNITVFTSNQPRHISLINSLAAVGDKVYAIQECNTVFPGEVKDFFDNSDVMKTYFAKVRESEKNVFGSIAFSAENVNNLSIKGGDLNRLERDILEPALHSDIYVVFGASYIKGWLIDHLVEHKAINIHMGVSPYYRGNSCNFWALYDGHPEMVGATIHMLSRGLDSGDMLYHALPAPGRIAPFDLGMMAVKAAHESLVARISDGTIFDYEPVPQDKSKEIKYTRNSDFNDEVAEDYLKNPLTVDDVDRLMKARDLSVFKDAYIAY